MIVTLDSCQTKKDRSDLISSDFQTFTFDADRLDSANMSNRFYDFEFLHLVSKNDNLIHKINKVREYGDKIAILSRPDLWLVDQNGNVENKIGMLGNGPGEFIELTDFRIDLEEGSIEILDGRGKKLIKYDMNGEFISEIKHEAFQLAKGFMRVSDDIYAIYGGTFFVPTFDFGLLYFSKSKNKVVDKFFPIKEKRPYAVFLERDNFWIENEDKLFSYPFNDTIYKLTPEKLIPKVVIDFGEKSFPPELLNKDFNDVMEFMEYCKSTPYAYKISNHCQTQDANLFIYELGGQRRYGAYSQISQRTLSISTEGAILDQLYYFLKYPRGSGEKNFYFEIEPSRLLSEFDNVKKSVGEIEWKKLKNTNIQLFDLYENLSINDGNVLVSARFRPVR